MFFQNTSDNDYLYLKDREKAKYEAEEIELLKRRRDNLNLDISNQQRKKREAEVKWDGHDEDRDGFNDGGGSGEIAIGTHNLKNVPQHKPILRRGPTTQGSAYAGGGSIVFDYDDSIIDLNINRSHSVIGGVHKMNTPKKMKLTVDYGDKHHHVNSMSGFKIDLDCHPELFRMNTNMIKPVGYKNVKVVKKSPKQGIKSEAKKDRSDINELSTRLSGFVKKQKKSDTGIDLIGGKNLDFSHVGISTGLIGKKKKGWSI